MNKGAMALIDEPRAEAIYASMGPAIEIFRRLGREHHRGRRELRRARRVCRQGEGRRARQGVQRTISAPPASTFTHQPATDGPSTARCYMLVTPDGERTMNTYLGAAQNLSPADLDEQQIAAAGIIYLEGYLWDPPQAKDAFRKAAEIAHGAGRKVALTLSDAFCVDRYRDEFLNLMRTGAVDLVFANESELHSLYQTADFDTALAALRNDVKLAVVTRSEKGCVVVSRESERGGAGRADRQVRRRDRRRRPVRRRVPGRTRARPGPSHCARLGAHRGRRSDPASRRAAGDLAEGPRAGERAHHMSGSPVT